MCGYLYVLLVRKRLCGAVYLPIKHYQQYGHMDAERNARLHKRFLPIPA